MAHLLTMSETGRLPEPPAYLKRRVGYVLGELREAAGLSLDAVAKRVQLTKSSLSRYEDGQTAPKLHALRALMDMYADALGGGLDDVLRRADVTPAQMEDMARRAVSPGWRTAMFGEGAEVPTYLQVYVGLEATANALCIYDYNVPGLFQTPEYAECVVADSGRSGSELEWRVRLRELRQQMLTNRGPHPLVHAVLDESVLHRQVGGPDVAKAQMRHLVALAKLDHITIQIVPFWDGGVSAAVGAGSVILEFDSSLPPLVYLESYDLGHFIEDPDQVERFRLAFARLTNRASSPERSKAMLAKAGREG